MMRAMVSPCHCQSCSSIATTTCNMLLIKIEKEYIKFKRGEDSTRCRVLVE